MKLKIKWKDDFIHEEWYQNNPAELYLDLANQKQLIRQWLFDDLDLDSEAEVVLEPDD